MQESPTKRRTARACDFLSFLKSWGKGRVPSPDSTSPHSVSAQNISLRTASDREDLVLHDAGGGGEWRNEMGFPLVFKSAG